MGHQQWSRRTCRSTSQEETEFLAGTTESRGRENASDVGKEKESGEESREELNRDTVGSDLAGKLTRLLRGVRSLPRRFSIASH